MTTLLHRRQTAPGLNQLIESAPRERASLSDDHRRSLAARFRAIASVDHRRLDAWMVEQAGKSGAGFRWSPATARRTLGNAALRRLTHETNLSMIEAVNDELMDQLLRAAAGYARRGSLAWWLAGISHAELGLVSAEAVNWATQLAEIARSLDFEWKVSSSDAYYDVARARTTLRGRRDLEIVRDDARVIVRLRSGSPGKSAGPGLRSDLTIETLAHPDGLAPARMIGIWPEAGVCLSVDGTMDDLRSGARDLVRTAVVQQRAKTSIAA
jgi:hypothetical protein